jgi:hypothetical protein
VRKTLMAAVAAGAACVALTAGTAGTASAQVALERTPTAAKTQVRTDAPPWRTQPAAASASVALATPTAKRCGENFFYISGNGVRIRKSPGGTILGYANYWERVAPGHTSGSWTYVNFYNRSSGVTQGWVSSQFVSFHQPTCW